jgi:transposase InsO family protein
VRVKLETQLRAAIREAVNRGSRKPFFWGGLKGYEQLESIAQVLEDLSTLSREMDDLGVLRSRVKRVLTKNRTVAQDLKQAYQLLLAVARCLHYPPAHSDRKRDPQPSRQQVAEEMTHIIQDTHPTGQIQHAQKRLLGALKRRWGLFGAELLYCYEIPGLPQDNLKLESLFGRLRRHQRRISGRPSTHELQAFGQAQVLFTAPSFPALLDQLQHVPREIYEIHRHKLAEAEQSRQFFHRLHQNPDKALTAWIRTFTGRSLLHEHLKSSITLHDLIYHTE